MAVLGARDGEPSGALTARQATEDTREELWAAAENPRPPHWAQIHSSGLSEKNPSSSSHELGAVMTHGQRAKPRNPQWRLLTKHAQVLILIATTPTITVRDVSAQMGVTEREVYYLMTDLISAGYLAKTRAGRRNSYRVQMNSPLRHPLECGGNIAALAAMFGADHPALVLNGFE